MKTNRNEMKKKGKSKETDKKAGKWKEMNGTEKK